MKNCPKCDAHLEEYLCKLICPNHGVITDCSDPF